MTSLISRYWLLILGIVVVVSVAAFFTQPNSQSKFHASMGINAQYINTPSGTTMDAASTLQKWITDPSIITKVFGNEVGETVVEKSLAFEVTSGPIGSTMFSIERTGTNRQQLENEMTKLRSALVATNSTREKPLDLMDITVTVPVISESNQVLPFAPIAGLVAGLVLAGVVVSLLERPKRT